MVRRWLIVFVILGSMAGFSSGCEPERDPTVLPTNPRPDTGEPDVGDAGDSGDVGDAGEPDADAGDAGDVGEPDADADLPDADAGEPEERICPEDLAQSCAADLLSCLGNARAQNSCAALGDYGVSGSRVDVEFTNGARLRHVWLGSGRASFEAYGPDGELCYQGVAQDDLSPHQSWRISRSAAARYTLTTEEGQTEVACADGATERCSQARLEQFFAMPFQAPEDCPVRTPQDTCGLDSDCASGSACCALSEGEFLQCLDEDFCIDQREPVLCDTSDDCSPDESCARCTRSGQRECVPDAIVDDPTNSLGCVPDTCQLGDSCEGEGGVCCLSAGSYRCIEAQECDQAPDPNPVCDPASQVSCQNGDQLCCYVDQLTEFRCLSNTVSCRTNVCFSDNDCPGSEQCCGVDVAQGLAGSCQLRCQSEAVECSSQDDCAALDGYCCRAPGVETGQCVTDERSCDYPGCSPPEGGASVCPSWQVCCDEAPLTSAVCVSSDACPPT